MILHAAVAGGQGKRGALPSSTIMLRQPMQRFTQMQASDIDIYRNELRKTKNEIVSRLHAAQLHPARQQWRAALPEQ
jgi:ATP-dependent Clp protease protease subunit